MRVFRLCLTAGIVVMLSAFVLAPAAGASSDNAGSDNSVVGSSHGKDGGAGVGQDGGRYDDNDDNDDHDGGGYGVGKDGGAGVSAPVTGAPATSGDYSKDGSAPTTGAPATSAPSTGVGKDAGAGAPVTGGGQGIGEGAGADVPTTGGGYGVGKDGGGHYDDNDDNGGGYGAGKGADMPTTGAGGLAVAGGMGSMMLFGGVLTIFGAIAASGLGFFRRR